VTTRQLFCGCAMGGTASAPLFRTWVYLNAWRTGRSATPACRPSPAEWACADLPLRFWVTCPTQGAFAGSSIVWGRICCHAEGATEGFGIVYLGKAAAALGLRGFGRRPATAGRRRHPGFQGRKKSSIPPTKEGALRGHRCVLLAQGDASILRR